MVFFHACGDQRVCSEEPLPGNFRVPDGRLPLGAGRIYTCFGGSFCDNGLSGPEGEFVRLDASAARNSGIYGNPVFQPSFRRHKGLNTVTGSRVRTMTTASSTVIVRRDVLQSVHFRKE